MEQEYGSTPASVLYSVNRRLEIIGLGPGSGGASPPKSQTSGSGPVQLVEVHQRLCW